jgi:hypothetical protein
MCIYKNREEEKTTNSILKKSWIVVVLCLLIGISIAPVIDANFNNIFSINKNNGESDEGFVEVSCQVSTLSGVKQVVKDISKDKLEKITNLANEINSYLSEKGSVYSLRNKVFVLVVELKEVGLLPRDTVIGDTANIMVQNIIHKIDSRSFLSDNHSDNQFCFIFGTGDNKTAFLAWRQDPLILLRILLWEILGLDDPYEMGSVIRLFLYKPKFLVLNGQWVSYSTNATLISVGLNGIYKIKDEGYGAYCLTTLGFIGISVGSSVGGFICGFCLYTDMYFNQIE